MHDLKNIQEYFQTSYTQSFHVIGPPASIHAEESRRYAAVSISAKVCHLLNLLRSPRQITKTPQPKCRLSQLAATPIRRLVCTACFQPPSIRPAASASANHLFPPNSSFCSYHPPPCPLGCDFSSCQPCLPFLKHCSFDQPPLHLDHDFSSCQSCLSLRKHCSDCLPGIVDQKVAFSALLDRTARLDCCPMRRSRMIRIVRIRIYNAR